MPYLGYVVATIVLGALLAFAVFALVIWALAECAFRAEYAQACNAMRKIEARAIVRVPVSTILPTVKGKVRT